MMTERRDDCTAGASSDEDRRGGTRPIATLVPKLTRKVLGKHGFSSAALISEWPAIVGNDLAAACTPVNLAFRRGQRNGGMLVVRAAGGAALELQHVEPVVIERINTFLGYRAVNRLKIVHWPTRGPIRGATRARKDEDPVAAPQPFAEPAPPPASSLAKIADSALRTALARLADAIRRDRPNRTR